MVDKVKQVESRYLLSEPAWIVIETVDQSICIPQNGRGARNFQLGEAGSQRRAQLFDVNFSGVAPPVTFHQHVPEQIHAVPALFEKVTDHRQPDRRSISELRFMSYRCADCSPTHHGSWYSIGCSLSRFRNCPAGVTALWNCFWPNLL